ncbi:glycosyltransferase [Mucilaginibacter sp.]|uniref:glycosyltransferase n=1 Tax=Mucilaginibacter sp. TaxID=1882438 RepID=UPI00262A20A9|nr:glycosyltransferase [Mucilaginibacter sp.]MDB4927017.1 glycosyltransferase family 2 protein [Mucilaginibacter sp.]
MSQLNITVIVPSYNPVASYLETALNSLKNQTLPLEDWELIIVDNNSNNNVLQTIDLTWHPNAKLINESKQGLTHSRVTGVNNANANIIVMVDDDNILANSYLETVLHHFNNNPNIGAIGGKIKGLFIDSAPDPWTEIFWSMLAIRDFGGHALVSDANLLSGYPNFAPVGAGLSIRKQLFFEYSTSLNTADMITDRSAGNLASGGDNEINIQILKQGFALAYFPDLELDHIIPASRLTATYLSKLNYESSKSWVRLLLKHNICPWAMINTNTLILRKIKAWFKYKPWSGPIAYINWNGACGTFEALAGQK